MNKSVCILAVAVVCLFTAGGASHLAYASDADRDAEFQAILDKYVDGGIPGIIMNIRTSGEVSWAGASGMADAEAGEAMTPGLMSRIGSTTKSFVSAVILQLAEEGKLSLDDTLEDVLPGVMDVNTDVTIRQLLNMTSGFYDCINESETLQAAVDENPLRTFTISELLAYGQGQPAHFAPGEAYMYCNTNYLLLGAIIQELTGNPPGEEIQNRICTPLGLNSTYFGTVEPTFPGPYMHGYYDIDGDGTLDDISNYCPSFASTAGDGISTAEDMSRWAFALFEGEILNEVSMQELLTSPEVARMPNPGRTHHYALGVLYTECGSSVAGVPFRYWWHNGSIYGYRTMMAYLPDYRVSVAIFMDVDAEVEAGRIGKLLYETFAVFLGAQSGIAGWESMR